MPYDSCIYEIGKTTTFRLASSGIITNWLTQEKAGGNLQNKEQSMRRIYIPPKGMKFVQADQSGAEALVVAYLCNPGLFRDLFLNNIKIHTYVALIIFKKQLQEKISREGLDIKCNLQELIDEQIGKLKKHPFWKATESLIKDSDNWPAEERYYFIGKQTAHSSNYGIKAFRFMMNILQKSRGKIAITQKQAEIYLSMYHGLFPEIRAWHRQVEHQVRETGILYSLQGYPLEFISDFQEENDLKEAYAAVPQCTVATITNTAYTRIQETIETEDLPFDLITSTHDSILGQCPDDPECELALARLLHTNLCQELKSPRGEIFRMKSEVKSGYNWSNFNKDRNPNGLIEINV